MDFSNRKLIASAVLLSGFVGIAGCQGPAPSYPTAPPVTKSSMMSVTTPATMPAIIKVPASAVELSSGDYPPPSFPAPTQPGLIEVVDLNTDPTIAVATTAVAGTGGDAAKQMSITDITNMSVSLNKNHKYRIVFVPLKPGTQAP